jgi:hypothetical protein
MGVNIVFSFLMGRKVRIVQGEGWRNEKVRFAHVLNKFLYFAEIV